MPAKLTDNGTFTIKFVFNGTSFARQADTYCRQNGLSCSWSNDGRRFWSTTVIEVSGTATQMQEFMSWANDRFRPKGSLAATFADEPFMIPGAGCELN